MDIKLKTHKKRGSVFTLLLQNYVLFTILLALLLTGLVFIYSLRTIILIAGVEPSQIEKYQQILKEELYEEFPVEKLLGRNSFIAILDQQSNVKYQSKEDVNLPRFNSEDLSYIADYIADADIRVRNITTSEGVEQMIVSIYELTNDSEHEYILNMKGDFVYQTGEFCSNALTPLQIKLLSDTYDDGYNLRKYSFYTKEGQHNTLLLFRHREALETNVGHSWSSFFYLFWFVYGILLLIFIILLKNRIQRPLQILCSQLNSFSSGDVSQVNYSGPREFVEIFESFYRMSLRLEESEKKRKCLQADKQKMLADISHDLKTPITVIKGYAKALCDGVIPPDEERQYLETIEQKSEHLDTLINTFYEYSKTEHPDYSLILKKTNICNYLRDYVAERYTELEINGFFVQVDIPEEQIFCEIDTKQLKRVFENIVNNAVKHNLPGTTLYFQLKNEYGNIRMIFADNGVGISMEMRQHIFDPFVMGESSRSSHGSGLGLSIAKKIVEAHKGQIILLEPKYPYNTAFEIILPINKNQLFLN